MWNNEKPLCTTKELSEMIMIRAFAFSIHPYNEVYPNIYIGTGDTAMNIEVLKNLGITHILNAAFGKGKFFFVNTSAEYYEPHNIKFMGVPAIDVSSFQLEPYFEQGADFIEEAIHTGGRVLVHCFQGMSRSATLVLAYLMIKEGMTVQNAMRTVRVKRTVVPNCGFLQQLCNLNEKLQMDKLSRVADTNPKL